MTTPRTVHLMTGYHRLQGRAHSTMGTEPSKRPGDKTTHNPRLVKRGSLIFMGVWEFLERDL